MIQFTKEARDALIHKIRNNREPATREGARAELDSILISDLVYEMRESSELIHGGVSTLAGAIRDHQGELGSAAESADRSSKELASLTAALVRATRLYVWLTGGLLAVASFALAFQIVQWAYRAAP